MSHIDKLCWIRLRDGHVLSTRSRGKDTCYLPGGKREHGESDWQALRREIREELSVELVEASLERVGVFEVPAHGHPEGTLVRMTCYTADFVGELRAAAEIEEILWLGYADRHRSSAVDQIIFAWLHERGLLK